MKNKAHKSAKRRTLISLICVISIAIIIALAQICREFLNFSNPDVANVLISILEAVGLVVSLFIAIRQLGDSKEIARAQFLTELNKSFVENKDYCDLYNALQNCYDNKCDKSGECAKNKKCALNFQKGLVSNYLTFFETIYLLIQDGVISLPIVDDLFAYRFFLAVHSQFVQETKIQPQPENFANIFKLEHDWLAYRESIGKIAKPGSVYAERQLKTLVSEEKYAELIKKREK